MLYIKSVCMCIRARVCCKTGGVRTFISMFALYTYIVGLYAHSLDSAASGRATTPFGRSA